MQGTFLRFYVHEGHRHRKQYAWEWLLEQGNQLGIRGGSAFKAIAAFGRHHQLHEARFYRERALTNPPCRPGI
jgi:PII-like signaling protein